MSSELAAVAPAESKRVGEYDVARLVSIVFVVLIHILAPYVAPELERLGTRGPIALMSWELRFAVSMFVLLTGALIWNRQPDHIAAWPRFYSRRLRIVIEPYLFWSALYMLIGVYVTGTSLVSVRQVVLNLVLGTSWYHLYFVPAIIGVYLMTPLAIALNRHSKLIALLAFTLIGTVVPVLLASNTRTIARLVSLVLLFLPYAAFGAWHAHLRQSGSRVLARWWPVLLTIGLGVRGWLVLGGQWPSSPYVRAVLAIALNVLPALGILGLSEVLVKIRPGIGRVAGVWATFGFGVYLGHPLLLLIADKLARATLPDGQLPFPVALLVLWPLTVITSLAAVRMSAHLRWLRPIHGVTTDPRVSAR